MLVIVNILSRNIVVISLALDGADVKSYTRDVTSYWKKQVF